MTASATMARSSSEVPGGHSWAKRALDVGLSGTGLFFSLPLWAIAAIAIKLEDGGPVFYGQERVGCTAECSAC